MRASADCAQAARAAAGLGSPGTSYVALNHYSRRLYPIVEQLIDGLDSLSAPASNRVALARFVTALHTGSRGLELLAEADTHAQTLRAVSLIGSQPVAALARSLGAPACATTPQP